MRKRMIEQESPESPLADVEWLDLERLAQAEYSSEDPAFPLEGALVPGSTTGWRASTPGEQIIRLVFDKPVTIGLVQLLVVENDTERTQEFVLRWAREGEETLHEVVRQQYHFSPPTTTTEIEDYGVQLNDVKVLELSIIPDISGGTARASLEELRVG